MRSFDEIEKNAYKKADIRLARKKHRQMMIRRTAALALGTAAVLVIGISAQVLRLPKKPESSDSIIIETSTAATSSAAPTSVSPTAETPAETTIPKTTATVAVKVTSVTSQTTASRTTAQTSAVTAAGTTAAPVRSTTAAATTTAVQTMTTNTDAAPAITTAYVQWSLEPPFTTTKSYSELYTDMLNENFNDMQLFGDKDYIRLIYTVAPESIEELVREMDIEPQKQEEMLPDSINVKVYSIKGIDTDLCAAVRLDDADTYCLYSNKAPSVPTIGDLLSSIGSPGNIEFLNASYSPDVYSVEKDRVFDTLFADMSAPKSGSAPTSYDVELRADIISLSAPVCFRVRWNGYVAFELCGKNYCYFIGKGNANAFIDYVTESCPKKQ